MARRDVGRRVVPTDDAEDLQFMGAGRSQPEIRLDVRPALRTYQGRGLRALVCAGGAHLGVGQDGVAPSEQRDARNPRKAGRDLLASEIPVGNEKRGRRRGRPDGVPGSSREKVRDVDAITAVCPDGSSRSSGQKTTIPESEPTSALNCARLQ
jgi:hypothetical protein